MADELAGEVERLRSRVEAARGEAEAAERALADERARRAAAEQQASELYDRINERITTQTAPRPDESTAIGASPLVAAGEQISVLQDAFASLRSSMRAASDEAAMMDQTDSVQVVSSALSQAVEEIERARDALRALADLAQPSER